MINEFVHSEDLIYKYVPFSTNLLKILINGELWFGFPNNLNDPFEGQFTITGLETFPSDELVLKFLEKNLEMNVNRAKSVLGTFKNSNSFLEREVFDYINKFVCYSYGVCSFAIDPFNIQMWSHYADSHSGVCLAFNREQLIESCMSDNTIRFRRVHGFRAESIDYVDEIPSVKIEFTDNGLNEFKIDWFSVLLKKLKSWEYEQEFRLIFYSMMENWERTRGFDRSCLKYIFFGEKMNEENKKTIMNLMSDERYSIKWGDVEKRTNSSSMIIKEYEVSYSHRLKP